MEGGKKRFQVKKGIFMVGIKNLDRLKGRNKGEIRRRKMEGKELLGGGGNGKVTSGGKSQ